MKAQNIELRIKSVENNIKSYYNFISKILKKLNIKHSVIYLPRKIKRLTLLKSPHVNKKAREQFEIRIYKILIKLSIESQGLSFLKHLILNKPKYLKLSLRRII